MYTLLGLALIVCTQFKLEHKHQILLMCKNILGVMKGRAESDQKKPGLNLVRVTELNTIVLS